MDTQKSGGSLWVIVIRELVDLGENQECIEMGMQ